ncbi:MAG: histone deacetylase [Planctomycetes bacterium]|nr:histone deacetylase [Planctomycetota bacterium]
MPLFVYHPRYELKWGGHVFPVEKYRLLHDRLIAEGLVREDEFVIPESATDDELLLVHTRAYLDRLEELVDRPLAAMLEFEAPYPREVADAVRYATGGSIVACERALASRTAALNLGGGFHHAFPDHGEGFCFINDVAVAVRVTQARGLAHRVAVIDCDLHQGNGTAAIFRGDPDVFTFSIHQEELYPMPKAESSLDVGLDEAAGDAAYLAAMERHVPAILDAHRPDLVLYLAGADPFEEDQLGNLGLTRGGLRRRDELVLSACRERGLPIALVLAGGYARRTEDVVDIHLATCRAMRETYGP